MIGSGDRHGQYGIRRFIGGIILHGGILTVAGHTAFIGDIFMTGTIIIRIVRIVIRMIYILISVISVATTIGVILQRGIRIAALQPVMKE